MVDDQEEIWNREKEMKTESNGKLRIALERLLWRYPLLGGLVATWDCRPVGSDTMAMGMDDQGFTLYYCPDFVAETSIDQLVGVLHHEARHVFYGHVLMDPDEFANKDALLVAQEVTVNEGLPEPLPEGAVRLEDFPELPPDEDTLTRYNCLRSESHKNLQSKSDKAQQGKTGETQEQEPDETSQDEGDSQQGEGGEKSDSESGDTPQDESNSTPRGEGGKTTEGESGKTSKDKGDGSQRGEGSDRPDGESTDTSQGDGGTPQGESGEKSDSESANAPQDESDDTPQGENGEQSDNESGDAPQGNDGGAPKDECGEKPVDEPNRTSQDDGDGPQQDEGGKTPVDESSAPSQSEGGETAEGESDKPSKDQGSMPVSGEDWKDDHGHWQEIRGQESHAKNLISIAVQGFLAAAEQRPSTEAEEMDAVDLACQAWGITPGTELTQLPEVHGEPTVDWRRVLRRRVGRLMTKRPTYSRPPRRFPDLIGIIPGTAQSATKPTIMAIIDTSLSMTDELLGEISRELQFLTRDHQIVIVECDVTIQAVYPYRPIVCVKGRGGTDFRPPLDRAFLRKNAVDLVVFFTDGDGPAPEHRPYLPVIWVLTPDGTPPASWGEVIRMGKISDG